MRSPKPEEGAPGHFGLLGMSGAVLGGVGLGVAAASGGLLFLVPEDEIAVPAVLVGAGGVAAAVGGGMLLLDGLE